MARKIAIGEWLKRTKERPRQPEKSTRVSIRRVGTGLGATGARHPAYKKKFELAGTFPYSELFLAGLLSEGPRYANGESTTSLPSCGSCGLRAPPRLSKRKLNQLPAEMSR